VLLILLCLKGMCCLYLKGLRNPRKMTPRPLKNSGIKLCYSAEQPKRPNPHLYTLLTHCILGCDNMSSGRLFWGNTLPSSLEMREFLAKFGRWRWRQWLLLWWWWWLWRWWFSTSISLNVTSSTHLQPSSCGLLQLQL
jgi:hypothetical protein